MITHSEFRGLGYQPETGLFFWTEFKKGRRMGHPVGTKDSLGYLMVNFNGKTHRLHRLAFLFTSGYLPKIVDHINRDRTDNRLCNIRETNRSGNGSNRTKIKGTTSKYIGVHWDRERGKWSAGVKKNGKTIKRKRFDCEHEAARWRDEYAGEHHGEFAALNNVV